MRGVLRNCYLKPLNCSDCSLTSLKDPIHTMPVVFLLCMNFTLFTVDNIYHSQNVSSNRNETLTVTCSHSVETVEFRYGSDVVRSDWTGKYQNFSLAAAK